MADKIMVDTHTHTVLSGHAFSTLRENARAAAQHGLAGMVQTEHAHALPGAGPWFLPAANKMLPPYIEGVRLYRGVEANILDFTGRLDTENRLLRDLDFTIATLHDVCIKPGTEVQNTEAYLGALNNPYVDMLGHIDDAKTPNDFETVITEAVRLGKLIEINNNSIRIRRGSPERIARIAKLCMLHGCSVAVSTDAHFDEMLGMVEPALRLLADVGFPDELIVNRTLESFEAFLATAKARKQC